MEYLVLIRIISAVLGFFFSGWAFTRFRSRFIKRSEFLFLTVLGASLVVVSIYPDSINVVASMMALDNRQYGRIISLLILSNMMLWVLLIGQRNKDGSRAVQFDLLVRRMALENFFEKNERTALKEITIIIPALNESENLDYLLPAIPDKIMGHEVGVLVVDDGSDDNTREIVIKHGYAVVSNPFRRGGGAALRLGYDIAMAAGASYIVTMDADGQHLPEEIGDLIAPLLKGDLDIVIGSRILGKHGRENVFRWAGIHVFNFIINFLAGTRITDCSCGFRAFRMNSLKKVLLLQDQFHTAELIIDAAKKKLKIGETPVTHVLRHSGKSKKGKDLSYGINFSKTILKSWLRK